MSRDEAKIIVAVSMVWLGALMVFAYRLDRVVTNKMHSMTNKK